MKNIIFLLLAYPFLVHAQTRVDSAGNIIGYAKLADPTFTGTVGLPNNTITNAMLNGSIAYAKLALTGAILNADLAGSIAASKLVGTDIVTVGTIATGTWNATAIADGKIASALTGKTYNGLTITATAGTLTIPNNASAALVLSGNFSQTYTATGTTNVTFPTSGTLVSSVTTANGVSASNTSGALSFTLGAITPTTINGLTITSTAGTLTIPNNASAALILSGNFSTTLTATGTTTVTLPTSGTLVSSVTTANGVSASNTAGALSFTLGAITPTTVNGNTFTTGSSTYTGTAGQTYTFPTTTATIARTDAAQTFTGQSTFAGGLINSGSGAITSATSAIANTDTKIVSTTTAMVASRLVAGTVIEVLLHGTATSTAAGAGTITVRYGTNGTTADGALQAFTLAAAPTSGTNVPFTIRIFITIRTTGASATSDGELDLVNNGITGLSATATQVIRGTATNINTTTASTFLTVSYISGNASTAATFQDAVITILNK